MWNNLRLRWVIWGCWFAIRRGNPLSNGFVSHYGISHHSIIFCVRFLFIPSSIDRSIWERCLGGSSGGGRGAVGSSFAHKTLDLGCVQADGYRGLNNVMCFVLLSFRFPMTNKCERKNTLRFNLLRRVLWPKRNTFLTINAQQSTHTEHGTK